MLIELLLIAAQPQNNVEPVVAPMVDWVVCYTSATDRFASQPESADTVATAVLGACEAEESRLKDAIYLIVPRPTTAEVEAHMAMLRDNARRHILGVIFQTRTARSRGN